MNNFYPRSPRGERLAAFADAIRGGVFLSTLPARGATASTRRESHRRYISIHAPREGSDGPKPTGPRSTTDFYPRSPRGERHKFRGGLKKWAKISIHAPREGSDCSHLCNLYKNHHFYPRSPRGERRASTSGTSEWLEFLSTLPARGATSWPAWAAFPHRISIHAPREGSDRGTAGRYHQLSAISIHAPREGSDGDGGLLIGGYLISIHAPREGSDRRWADIQSAANISIHAPREGSDAGDQRSRGPTAPISIHAPREGSDLSIRSLGSVLVYFYPRSPRGERPVSAAPCSFIFCISIHAPREGSDCRLLRQPRLYKFLSTLPARGATK